MKGYGLPRDLDVEYPDKADVRYFGLSSKYDGRYRGKRSTRRLWKRRARREGKKECRDQVEDL